MDNENAAKRGVETFIVDTTGRYEEFEQFVGRIDGNGGFAVVGNRQRRRPARRHGKVQLRPTGSRSIPVVDIARLDQAATDGIRFRESIS